MPFQFQVANILSFNGDAIVNPLYKSPKTARDLDLMIRSKGSLLYRLTTERMYLLPKGEAAITRSSGLNCAYVIYTKVPRCFGRKDQIKQLRNCYRNVFSLVSKHGLKEIALPLLGRGYPKDLALRIALEEISSFLSEHEETNILVVIPRKKWFQLNSEILSDFKLYNRIAMDSGAEWGLSISADAFREAREQKKQIDRERQNLAIAHRDIVWWYSASPDFDDERSQDQCSSATQQSSAQNDERNHYYKAEQAYYDSLPGAAFSQSITDGKSSEPYDIHSPSSFNPGEKVVLDESFSHMVMRLIDEKGYKKDSDCYKKANIDKRLFSKIRTDVNYHPKKATALALAIALELPPDQTRELLMKAGYTLSRSILFDVIVEYFILNRNYNIFEINALLFEYDQPLLGA